MSVTILDDQHDQNPVLSDISAEAYRVWAFGLVVSGRRESKGHLDPMDVRYLNRILGCDTRPMFEELSRPEYSLAVPEQAGGYYLPGWAQAHSLDQNPTTIRSRKRRAEMVVRNAMQQDATPARDQEDPPVQRDATPSNGAQRPATDATPMPEKQLRARARQLSLAKPSEAELSEETSPPTPHGEPPAPGYEWSTELDWWFNPTTQEAWPMPEPSLDTGAALEVWINRLGKQVQDALHDRKLTGSWPQVRRTLTENRGVTLEDVTGAVDEALITEGAGLRSAIAYITTPYEKGGMALLEKHRRRRVDGRITREVEAIKAEPTDPVVADRFREFADTALTPKEGHVHA